MGYSAAAVANYFLDLAEKEDKEITPLQMQKLVYVAHGWWMALHGKEDPLIDDEYAEAWDYGPVFPSLYFEFKDFGANPIEKGTRASVFNFDGDIPKIEYPDIPKKDEETKLFLNHIWKLYKNVSGPQFINITHRDDSPWDKTRKREPNINNANIDNRVIFEYYKERLKD